MFPIPHQRQGWASTTCAVAPLKGLCPGLPPPRGPPRLGLNWVVAHPPPARGQPCLAVRRPRPRWPRVGDHGGHCRQGRAVEVPLGPLRAPPPPPAGRPQRQPPLHMALVLDANVAGGDERAAMAADPAWPGGALGRPPRLLTPPATPLSHPLRGRDGRRQAPHRGG